MKTAISYEHRVSVDQDQSGKYWAAVYSDLPTARGSKCLHKTGHFTTAQEARKAGNEWARKNNA